MELSRITKETAENIVRSLNFEKDLFFTHHIPLNSILNFSDRELYLAKNKEESHIVLYKKLRNEYRFLFSQPSNVFLVEFKDKHTSEYIGCNFLSSKVDKEIVGMEQEVILDIEKILSMDNAGFRKKYNRAMRLNPQFDISEYSYKNDLEGIIEFLESWKWTRSEFLNQFAHIENDKNFLKEYGSQPYVKGVIIRLENKVIAYCLYIPYYKKDICLSMYSKVLRGYENLGVVLTVEKCKSMKKAGFEAAFLGSINNDFKRSVVWAGKIIETKSCELYRSPEVKFRPGTTPEIYSTILLN
jgi:hypothetical protein